MVTDGALEALKKGLAMDVTRHADAINTIRVLDNCRLRSSSSLGFLRLRVDRSDSIFEGIVSGIEVAC